MKVKGRCINQLSGQRLHQFHCRGNVPNYSLAKILRGFLMLNGAGARALSEIFTTDHGGPGPAFARDDDQL
jgi:hypothetical protein